MKEKKENMQTNNQKTTGPIHSALDLWRLMGGRSERVPGKEGRRPPDSMLAVLGDRVTYTFILDDEVASIHFDSQRGEIFFKGHNIAHLELSQRQKEALVQMKDILEADEKARKMLPKYLATLARYHADK